jgi:predicted dehydrogenase
MLDPALAGAGPLWNFGPHVIDTFLYLVDEPISSVSCRMSHEIHHLAIEDLATFEFTTASGVLGVGEVGYTLPGGYQRFFSLTTDAAHCGGTNFGCGKVLLRDGPAVPFAGVDSAEVYEVYVRDTLQRFEQGQPARATIADMARTLRVMVALRESAASGEPVALHP